MKIFVINGLPGTGKTKFGELVGEELRNSGIPFLHTSSILPIKHLMMSYETWNTDVAPLGIWERLKQIRESIFENDWDGVTKDSYWRGVMSEFKLKVLAEFPNLINDWLKKQSEYLGPKGVLFVDIREPENILLFEDYCQRENVGSVQKLLITRDTNADFSNYSDASVMETEYDICIHNPGATEGEDPFLGYKHVAAEFAKEHILKSTDLEIVNA